LARWGGIYIVENEEKRWIGIRDEEVDEGSFSQGSGIEQARKFVVRGFFPTLLRDQGGNLGSFLPSAFRQLFFRFASWIATPISFLLRFLPSPLPSEPAETP
jgi:hypothetical protein